MTHRSTHLSAAQLRATALDYNPFEDTEFSKLSAAERSARIRSAKNSLRSRISEVEQPIPESELRSTSDIQHINHKFPTSKAREEPALGSPQVLDADEEEPTPTTDLHSRSAVIAHKHESEELLTWAKRNARMADEASRCVKQREDWAEERCKKRAETWTWGLDLEKAPSGCVAPPPPTLPAPRRRGTHRRGHSARSTNRADQLQDESSDEEEVITTRPEGYGWEPTHEYPKRPVKKDRKAPLVNKPLYAFERRAYGLSGPEDVDMFSPSGTVPTYMSTKEYRTLQARQAVEQQQVQAEPASTLATSGTTPLGQSLSNEAPSGQLNKRVPEVAASRITTTELGVPRPETIVTAKSTVALERVPPSSSRAFTHSKKTKRSRDEAFGDEDIAETIDAAEPVRKRNLRRQPEIRHAWEQREVGGVTSSLTAMAEQAPRAEDESVPVEKTTRSGRTSKPSAKRKLAETGLAQEQESLAPALKRQRSDHPEAKKEEERAAPPASQSGLGEKKPFFRLTAPKLPVSAALPANTADAPVAATTKAVKRKRHDELENGNEVYDNAQLPMKAADVASKRRKLARKAKKVDDDATSDGSVQIKEEEEDFGSSLAADVPRNQRVAAPTRKRGRRGAGKGSVMTATEPSAPSLAGNTVPKKPCNHRDRANDPDPDPAAPDWAKSAWPREGTLEGMPYYVANSASWSNKRAINSINAGRAGRGTKLSRPCPMMAKAGRNEEAYRSANAGRCSYCLAKNHPVKLCNPGWKPNKASKEDERAASEDGKEMPKIRTRSPRSGPEAQDQNQAPKIRTRSPRSEPGAQDQNQERSQERVQQEQAVRADAGSRGVVTEGGVDGWRGGISPAEQR